MVWRFFLNIHYNQFLIYTFSIYSLNSVIHLIGFVNIQVKSTTINSAILTVETNLKSDPFCTRNKNELTISTFRGETEVDTVTKTIDVQCSSLSPVEKYPVNVTIDCRYEEKQVVYTGNYIISFN